MDLTNVVCTSSYEIKSQLVSMQEKNEVCMLTIHNRYSLDMNRKWFVRIEDT